MKELVDDTYASVDEAARVLRVSPKTVYRWISRGLRGRKLSAVRFGGTLGIHRRSLEQFKKHLIEPRDLGSCAVLPVEQLPNELVNRLGDAKEVVMPVKTSRCCSPDGRPA